MISLRAVSGCYSQQIELTAVKLHDYSCGWLSWLPNRPQLVNSPDMPLVTIEHNIQGAGLLAFHAFNEHDNSCPLMSASFQTCPSKNGGGTDEMLTWRITRGNKADGQLASWTDIRQTHTDKCMHTYTYTHPWQPGTWHTKMPEIQSSHRTYSAANEPLWNMHSHSSN